MQENIIVLKFGSSVLRSVHDLPNLVHEIYRWYRDGRRVIAVVSAIGNTTEGLIQESRTLAENPEEFATAELLATGERASAALLGIALDRAGVPARVVSPREIGFEVTGAPLDAEPLKLDAPRVRELLHAAPVLVVPGFFGADAVGRTHCLGRGGSDLTAAFLSVALAARCRLCKDVDGVYESDPADVIAHPRRFEQLNYEDALKVAGKLIQPKAVSYLQHHRTPCEVAALALSYQTTVHEGQTTTARPAPLRPPLEVVLLGCGIVGFGVYQRLIALPDHFRVIGVLVRDRPKHEAAGVPSGTLHTRSDTLRALRPSLVIDALPGLALSVELLTHFLRQGVHAVSANKATIAEYGAGLAAIARESGTTLSYSAAVGGAAPMLELCEHHRAAHGTSRRIRSIAAVLNGTCNFVLDSCAVGATLVEAVAQAQSLGFAEADPGEDLSGRDAARKLMILARCAFGTQLRGIAVQALDETVAKAARAAAAAGEKLRQVARAVCENNQVTASVNLERMTQDSPFYNLIGERNAMTLTLASGEALTVHGRGAGRWPTTEAIMADVLKILRAISGRAGALTRRNSENSTF